MKGQTELHTILFPRHISVPFKLTYREQCMKGTARLGKRWDIS